jgi:hypothetical protein
MKDTVFQSILKPLTKKLLEECRYRFQSDYDCEHFDTLEHLKTMIYAHLYEIKSLRCLEVAINSHPIGMKNQVKRSTLSDANRRRRADCFVWLLGQVMGYLPRRQRKEIKQMVRVLDSSPIPLKGKGYDEWAKATRNAHWQGLKLHVEYDVALGSPIDMAMSHANVNDVTMGQSWPLLRDTIYVFDKGYCDFNWWWRIHQQRAYFVTRLKRNTGIVIKHHEDVLSDSIIEDSRFEFKNRHPRGGKKNEYRGELRRICVKREGKTPLVLVTNLFEFPAEKIAELYRARWEIELFFKWIKQNLKLKKFLGRSANAVKIQLVTALMAYLLVQIFKMITRDQRRLQLVLVWVRHNLEAKISKVIKNHGPPLSFSKSLYGTFGL